MLFDRSTSNRMCEKIAFLIRKHGFYRKSMTAITDAIMKCAGVFDMRGGQIAHIENVKTFKGLYNAGNFLKKAHANYLQNHIVWILFGLTLCLIFIVVEGGVG